MNLRLVLLRLTTPWVMLLAACSSAPPQPEWQMNAKSSLDRATDALLAGNSRVEAVEFARARSELTRTGRPSQVAVAELTRCAARVASLAFDDCPGFVSLEVDASLEQKAYARYLAGAADASDVAKLPAHHQALIAAGASAAALAALNDPLAALVAAGVLQRRGEATPAIAAVAVEKASQQGWRRPLLAWLTLQLKHAESVRDDIEAGRLQRRIELLTTQPVGGATAP